MPRLTGDGSRQRLTVDVINVTNEKINDLSLKTWYKYMFSMLPDTMVIAIL